MRLRASAAVKAPSPASPPSAPPQPLPALQATPTRRPRGSGYPVQLCPSTPGQEPGSLDARQGQRGTRSPPIPGRSDHSTTPQPWPQGKGPSSAQPADRPLSHPVWILGPITLSAPSSLLHFLLPQQPLLLNPTCPRVPEAGRVATGALGKAPASTGPPPSVGVRLESGGVYFCLFSGEQGQTGSLEFRTTAQPTCW